MTEPYVDHVSGASPEGVWYFELQGIGTATVTVTREAGGWVPGLERPWWKARVSLLDVSLVGPDPIEEVRAFAASRGCPALSVRRHAPEDLAEAELRGWRAGIEAAAAFLSTRGASSRERAARLRARPDVVHNEDVREALIQRLADEAEQDAADAVALRSLPAPPSMPDAARAADEALRAQHAAHVAQVAEGRAAARARADALQEKLRVTEERIDSLKLLLASSMEPGDAA